MPLLYILFVFFFVVIAVSLSICTYQFRRIHCLSYNMNAECAILHFQSLWQTRIDHFNYIIHSQFDIQFGKISYEFGMWIHQKFICVQYTYAKFHHVDACDFRKRSDVNIYIATGTAADDDDDTVSMIMMAQNYSRI